MEKTETPEKATTDNTGPACGEKWIKHWEERHKHTAGNAGKEIANMDRADFSVLLQEIEHH